MQSVFITGVSSGIGYVTALDLDRRGFRVFATVRREQDGKALAVEASPQLRVLYLDITDADAIGRAAAEVEATVGEAGLDGLIVSNHGGRQMDGGLAALDALPPIVEAVQGNMPVLFDSGIRRAADVLKAVALGARAVLLGRPYVFGLGVGGEQGVQDVVLNLLADLDLTLGLAGCRSFAEVGRESLIHVDEIE